MHQHFRECYQKCDPSYPCYISLETVISKINTDLGKYWDQFDSWLFVMMRLQNHNTKTTALNYLAKLSFYKHLKVIKNTHYIHTL
ncbi:hypothetical protein E27107_200326 [Elizabethkingia anophelis]|nr:hypothetical protein E18064_360330 [Elizabethkingia anophelis]CDN77673.1 hypothetical protein E27107_200326 [Elizabethkingia anophelis]